MHAERSFGNLGGMLALMGVSIDQCRILKARILVT